MKNPTLIVITLVVLTILGFGAYTITQKSTPQGDLDLVRKNDTTTDAGTSTVQNTPAASSISRYIEFSPSALGEAANTRRVLFFYANWCPTCRPADASFKTNAGQIPEDVTLIRVNYNDTETDNEEKDLAKKYTVTYQHTFVQIDATGNEVRKWNGGQIEELVTNIQ